MTEATISDRWAGRLDIILNLCLVMDRANCLFKMTYELGLKPPGPGMCWFSEEDLVSYPDKWKHVWESYRGDPTINKRLIWLKNVSKLTFERSILNPVAPSWWDLDSIFDSD